MEKYRKEYSPLLIGKNLKRLRLAKQLSVSDVQHYLRLGSKQAIYYYESGDRVPPGDNLIALLQLYSATIEDLIDETALETFDENSITCETRQICSAEQEVQLKDYKETTFDYHDIILTNCDFDSIISFENSKNKANRHEALVSYAEHIKAYMNKKAS